MDQGKAKTSLIKKNEKRLRNSQAFFLVVLITYSPNSRVRSRARSIPAIVAA